MYKKVVKILFLILISYHLSAQAGIDSLRLFNGVAALDLLSAKQQKNVRVNLRERQLALFVFLSPECPLCQNYTKTINELQAKFKTRVNIYGIIPGNAYTPKQVTEFEDEYHTNFNVLIDAKQKFTRYLKATVTPQAILLDSSGQLLYTGAIDDWAQGLGKKRVLVKQHYVQDAIEQTVDGGIVKVNRTKAYGCKINDY